MQESRTANALKNAKITFIVQIVNIVMNFISRTIFIKILGKEYLGVNGLFTNILTVLSFAELGIGNAIIYSMYKPIAEDNKEKIKALMNFYKKAYYIIGTIVAIAGILVIPFLKYIIKDAPNIKENLILIYMLFLINTSLSYFFTYKKSIISANQKEFIINYYKMVFTIIQNVSQIVILLVTKNFILYLIIQIICTFLNNFTVSKKADKLYNYIKDKDQEELSPKEKKSILTNIKSMALYKFGSVILNGTDNIIISSMIGVTTVGIYSNYTLIISAITSIIGQVLNAFTASVGNLNAVGTKKQQERVLYELLFVSIVIYGFCSGALFTLIGPFIRLWIGEEYLLSTWTLFSIILHFYINGIQVAAYTYRNTMGLFNKGKYAPAIAAVINIVLSIVLGKYIGLTGIFLATSISRLATTTWLDPYLIFKYKIDSKLIKYFKKYINYTLVVALNIVSCQIVFNNIKTNGIGSLIIKATLYVIITSIIYFAFFYKTEEFKGLKERFKKMMTKGRKDELY